MAAKILCLIDKTINFEFFVKKVLLFCLRGARIEEVKQVNRFDLCIKVENRAR